VIIDTPPSINGLTRTAWVSSDRVLIVTEPAIFSVVAADRAMRAIEELRKGLTPRLKALGVVINRVRPQSKEHEFRIRELNELFGDDLIKLQIEERSTIQQAQGATRAIHTWPGEQAAEIAAIFDRLLEGAMISFAQPVDKRAVKSERRFAKLSHIMRGQKFNDALAAEKVGIDQEQTLDEVIGELASQRDAEMTEGRAL
jgi:septum formation inhibitor-activating ATPase MinD